MRVHNGLVALRYVKYLEDNTSTFLNLNGVKKTGQELNKLKLSINRRKVKKSHESIGRERIDSNRRRNRNIWHREKSPNYVTDESLAKVTIN